MGKLTDLLKSKSVVGINKKPRITENVIATNQFVKTDKLGFNISEEDLKTVKRSIVEIDMTDKSRKQIIIGMYGGIKNPVTGKRFIIPNVDCTDDDYTYRYAEMMRTLVNRPMDFKKIMDWE